MCEYGGEPVTTADLTARYGAYTAPYGLHSRGPYYEDAACRRGAGSLANHGSAAAANIHTYLMLWVIVDLHPHRALAREKGQKAYPCFSRQNPVEDRTPYYFA